MLGLTRTFRLDAGGIHSYASLLLLQTIMDKVKDIEQELRHNARTSGREAHVHVGTNPSADGWGRF